MTYVAHTIAIESTWCAACQCWNGKQRRRTLTGAAETRVARTATEKSDQERRMVLCRAGGIVAAGRGDVQITEAKRQHL